MPIETLQVVNAITEIRRKQASSQKVIKGKPWLVEQPHEADATMSWISIVWDAPSMVQEICAVCEDDVEKFDLMYGRPQIPYRFRKYSYMRNTERKRRPLVS